MRPPRAGCASSRGSRSYSCRAVQLSSCNNNMRYKTTVPIVLALLLALGLYAAYTLKPFDTATHTPTVTEDPAEWSKTEVAAGFPAASESPANDTANTGPLAPPRTPPAGEREYRSEQYR